VVYKTETKEGAAMNGENSLTIKRNIDWPLRVWKNHKEAIEQEFVAEIERTIVDAGINIYSVLHEETEFSIIPYDHIVYQILTTLYFEHDCDRAFFILLWNERS
jgi:hypothetical protein